MTKVRNRSPENPHDLKRDTKLVSLLRNAVEASSDDSGRATWLPAVGSNIAKQWPEFDPRNYGYKKLARLWRRPSSSRSKNGPWATGRKSDLFKKTPGKNSRALWFLSGLFSGEPDKTNE